MKGDIARVRQAVADGVDVRKVVDKNWNNRTPLHHASWYVACETRPLYTLIGTCMPVCDKKGCLTYDPMSSIHAIIGGSIHAHADLSRPAYGWGELFGLS